LGDVKFQCGARDVFRFRHRHEIAQVP
jgi:hypothetical protein